MLETLDRYLLNRYLVDLDRELVIYGIEEPKRQELLNETRLHLEESIADTVPQSSTELVRVFEQFGTARSLAKAQARNLARPRSSRYLWPISVLLFFQVPIYWWYRSISIIGVDVWLPTFLPTLAMVLLLLAGFRARRPLFGQFVAFGVFASLSWTAWYTATSYPVKTFYSTGGADYQTVDRPWLDLYVKGLNGQITQERTFVATVLRGQAAYAKSDPNSVPGEFRDGNRFWLPETIRAISLGIRPRHTSELDFTHSFAEAKTAWVSSDPEEPSDADQLVGESGLEVLGLKKKSATLGGSRVSPSQPKLSLMRN